MKNNISTSRLKFIRFLETLIIIISVTVIIGWLLDHYEIVELFSGSATMKFNTAVGLALTGVCIVFPWKKKSLAYNLLVAVVFLIGLLTVMEYIWEPRLSIDTLIVEDRQSSSFPGRMSLGTAICFVLIGISLWLSNVKLAKFRNVSFYMLASTSTIAILSIVAFILQRPTGKRIFLVHTMSLSTSVLFLLISIAVFLNNNSYGLRRGYFKNLAGSMLMRSLFPFMIFIPVLMSYSLITNVNNGIIDFEFGVIINTVLLTAMGVIYVAFLGVKMNKVDYKRKKLEHFFKTNNEELAKYKYALDESSFVLIIDSEGKCKYANDKFCEVSQYSKEELIGNNYSGFVSGQHSSTFYAGISKKLRKGEVWVGGIKNQAKDGSFYWVHATVVPFRNNESEAYQFLAILQDITEHKGLSEKYKYLKLKNEEIEQFSYVASHDLQEPLNNLKSLTQIMKENYGEKIDEEGKDYLDFMAQSTTRMEELINGLLQYSRLGRDKKMELVNCNTLISEVMEELTYETSQWHTRITIHKLPEIKAYPAELKLLFQNIISNAAKFHKPNETPYIEIGSEFKNAEWVFYVRDNGIGIEQKDGRKIFAIFSRLNNIGEFDGTGIGLAYCEKIVRMHKGTIWFESELGKGTTFYFTINNRLK
jgi:PAS domain S-box-containing protein